MQIRVLVISHTESSRSLGEILLMQETRMLTEPRVVSYEKVRPGEKIMTIRNFVVPAPL